MVIGPSLAIAQTSTPPPATEAMDSQTICSVAQLDAKKMQSTGQYVALGIFCGLIGYIIAAGTTVTVPADRIAGKSPDYVSTYTGCYEKAAKKQITGAACGGWLAGWALAVGVASLVSTMNDVKTVNSMGN